MRVGLCVLLIIGILSFPQFSLGAPPTANLPLDSWVYPALDKLCGLGLIDSSLQGTRPYSRAEAARQAREAWSKAADGHVPQAVIQLLLRLRREFRDQLAENESGRELVTGSYFKPIRSLDMEYRFSDGEEARFPGTNAQQSPVNYNNFGIDYANRHNLQATVESEMRLTRFFLLNLRPCFLLEEQDEGGAGSGLRLLEGKGALELGGVEISAGRQALWWGQGRHGSLILTNNAKPLDMVRVTNPSPILLPWILKYLGPFRFDAFWSRLEEEREIPKPYFAGLRLTIKPFPWLELGGSRTAIFGGEGRSDIGISDFITILGGKNINGRSDTSDQLAALDFRLRLPFLGGGELYGEWGGEDEAGSFLSNMAFLGGVYLPHLEPSDRISLRLEYADLSHIDDNSLPWYQHYIYQSGYTYRGKILGHAAGGTARDVYGEIRTLLPAGVTLSVACDYQSRGSNQAVKEKHLQPAIGLEWQFRNNLTFSTRYTYDHVENFGYTSHGPRTFHLAEMGMKFTL